MYWYTYLSKRLQDKQLQCDLVSPATQPQSWSQGDQASEWWLEIDHHCELVVDAATKHHCQQQQQRKKLLQQNQSKAHPQPITDRLNPPQLQPVPHRVPAVMSEYHVHDTGKNIHDPLDFITTCSSDAWHPRSKQGVQRHVLPYTTILVLLLCLASCSAHTTPKKLVLVKEYHYSIVTSAPTTQCETAPQSANISAQLYPTPPRRPRVDTHSSLQRSTTYTYTNKLASDGWGKGGWRVSGREWLGRVGGSRGREGEVAVSCLHLRHVTGTGHDPQRGRGPPHCSSLFESSSQNSHSALQRSHTIHAALGTNSQSPYVTDLPPPKAVRVGSPRSRTVDAIQLTTAHIKRTIHNYTRHKPRKPHKNHFFFLL